MTWYKPWTWFSEAAPSSTSLSECDHGRPSEDSHYWYKLLEWETGEDWTGHDNTWVKLRSYDILWVCKYCGKTKHIVTSEEIGGPENIVRRQDLNSVVSEKPKASSGAYKGVEMSDRDKTIDEIIAEFEKKAKRRMNNE